MRVLMLGWEFPPFISGGLGVACYGLTKALSSQDVRVTFVLPKAVGAEHAEPHIQLLSPQSPRAASRAEGGANGRSSADVASTYTLGAGGFANVTFKAVPALFTNPYGAAPVGTPGLAVGAAATAAAAASSRAISVLTPLGGSPSDHGPGNEYAGDLILEARRYAELVLALAEGAEFDVIHAHDWLTFPAGMAVAAHTGKPLVVHMHSTEFDRSGENIDHRVYDIERRGAHAAVRVIAVSHLTKSILEKRYAVTPGKIDVVYNGIQNGPSTPPALQHATDPDRGIKSTDKIVLFLGRVTMQKGPEYFVAAAKRVLEKYDKVKFVMAGTGDKIKEVIELAAREGIGHKVLFTGFLRGTDVDKVFKMADVYVMPSVSEPFGIAALEAVAHDTPVIISKQSGVAEVLRHALKVDFWDVDEMANKIIAVLKHPPLSNTLRQHADMEVRRLTWDDAAMKTRQVYDEALRFMR